MEWTAGAVLVAMLGCAPAGVRIAPALRGDVVLKGESVDAVERRLQEILGTLGWTVVYLDTVHVFADRPGTGEERASLALQDAAQVVRRLECDVKQVGGDVAITYHTVRVVLEPTGDTKVRTDATTWDTRAARDNARVFDALRAGR